MRLLFKNNRKAITFVELMIAVAILGIVLTIVTRWFTVNSQYQRRITRQNECDNLIRQVVWEMHKDIKMSRTILYPRIAKITNNDLNDMTSDSKLVFRNFDGDIVSFYYNSDSKEIIRQVLHIPTGDAPPDEIKVIGKGLDNVVFTNRNEMNNLVGIYIEAGPSLLMDTVYMMNE